MTYLAASPLLWKIAIKQSLAAGWMWSACINTRSGKLTHDKGVDDNVGPPE